MSDKLKGYLDVIIEALKPNNNFFSSVEADEMQMIIAANTFDNVSLFEMGEVLSLVATDILALFGLFTMLIQFCLYYKKLSKDELFIKQADLLCQAADGLGFMLVGSFAVMYVRPDINWFEGFSVFGNFYVVNIYSQYMKLIAILIIAFLSRFLIISAAPEGNFTRLEQPLLVLVLLFLTTVMASCGNFVLLFLALEGFSLTLYLLPTQERVHGGVTAAFKYFSFGTLGSILIF